MWLCKVGLYNIRKICNKRVECCHGDIINTEPMPFFIWFNVDIDSELTVQTLKKGNPCFHSSSMVLQRENRLSCMAIQFLGY